MTTTKGATVDTIELAIDPALDTVVLNYRVPADAHPGGWAHLTFTGSQTLDLITALTVALEALRRKGAVTS